MNLIRGITIFVVLGLVLVSCVRQQTLPPAEPAEEGLSGTNASTVSIRVASSSDDAKERSADGSISLTSTNIELVDKADNQTVGFRFRGVTVPKGAVITRAYIQFKAGTTTGNTPEAHLMIHGQAHDNAPTFTTSTWDVTSRSRTSASVPWSPLPWTVTNEVGSRQRTPDITPVVQEIVSREGWSSGNALAIIFSGSGRRNARSFDGDQAGAPLLVVEYSLSSPPPPSAHYTLTVSKDGSGSGTVAGPGISCGDDCDEMYSEGATVALTASPATGSAFSGWSGACGGTGSCSVTMNGNQQVKATFDLAPSNGGAVQAIRQANAIITGATHGATKTSGTWFTIPSIDPASIVYHPPTGHLFIADSEINEVPEAWEVVGANIFEIPLTGGALYNKWDLTTRTNGEPRNYEPVGITYCPTDNHFYVANDDRYMLYRYSFENGSFRAVDWQVVDPPSVDPEGITCDPETGLLYVTNGKSISVTIYSYSTGSGFRLEGVLELVKTAGNRSGIPSDPEGIAFDPVSRNLFLVSDPDMAIFEYTTAGVFVKKYDISGFSPGPIAPQGLTVGPSSADAQSMSFYIADGGIDESYSNSWWEPDPDERDGVIYEAEIIRGN